VWFTLGFAQAPSIGASMGSMDGELRRAPTARRYSAEQKQHAVRMVMALRAELGSSVGMVARVARQLGYGEESLRRANEIGQRAAVFFG